MIYKLDYIKARLSEDNVDRYTIEEYNSLIKDKDHNNKELQHATFVNSITDKEKSLYNNYKGDPESLSKL